MTTVEKRKNPRLRRRLKVIVAEAGQQRAGTTTNLSALGITIMAPMLLVPGADVQGWIVLPTSTVPFRAEVMWAKKPAPGKALAEQNTAGLRFVGPADERYAAFVRAELAGLPQAELAASGGPSSTRPSIALPAQAPAPVPTASLTFTAPTPDPAPREPFEPAPREAAPREPAPRRPGASVPPPIGPTLGAAAPAGPRMPAPITRPPPMAGLPVDAETFVSLAPADLAPTADADMHTLTLRRATELVEETLVVALAGRTPGDLSSVGVELAVSVDSENAYVGQRVRIAAALVQQVPERESFFITIADGERTLARARYVRRLVPRQR